MRNRESRTIGGRHHARTAFLAALAAGALAGAGTDAQGAPGDDLHVAVHAPIGKGCISGDKLRVAVQKRIGSGATRRTVDVRIQTNDPDPGWVAEVAVTGRAGSRVVRTQSAACSQLDDGLVLVVTLLVDPEEEKPAKPPPPAGDPPPDSEKQPGGGSWGTEEPGDKEEPAEDGGPDAPAREPGAAKDSPGAAPDNGDDPPAEEPGANEPPPAKGTEKPAEDDAPAGKDAADKGDEAKDKAEKDAADKGKKTQFGIGAGLVVSTGLVPAALPGVRLSFEWMSPAPFPFEASFTYNARWTEYSADTNASWSRQVDSLAFEVQACPLGLSAGRLRLGACGGLALTYMEENFWGDDPSIPVDDPYYPGQIYKHQSNLMLSPTADLRADVTVFSWLRARVGFGGVVAVNPLQSAASSLSYSDRDLTAPVIFRGYLGIEAVLPP